MWRQLLQAEPAWRRWDQLARTVLGLQAWKILRWLVICVAPVFLFLIISSTASLTRDKSDAFSNWTHCQYAFEWTHIFKTKNRQYRKCWSAQRRVCVCDHLSCIQRNGLKYSVFLSKFKQYKVPQCPEATRTSSQHQNEPRGQSALGLLAPWNLAAWLAKPSDLASLGRERTPDNYQTLQTAQTV